MNTLLENRVVLRDKTFAVPENFASLLVVRCGDFSPNMNNMVDPFSFGPLNVNK